MNISINNKKKQKQINFGILLYTKKALWFLSISLALDIFSGRVLLISSVNRRKDNSKKLVLVILNNFLKELNGASAQSVGLHVHVFN